MVVSLKVPAGSKTSPGMSMSFPCSLPAQCGAAAVHAGPRSRSAVAHAALGYKVMDRLDPPWLSASYSLSIQFHKPSAGQQKKVELPLSSLGFPKPPSEQGHNFFLLTRWNNDQAFQRERKKLTKVEEEIQWTRSSQ